MTVTTENINRVLREKLQHLVDFLLQVTKGFENLAEEVDHTSLRSAMRAMAIESKQYAKEIANRFKQVEFSFYQVKDNIWQKMEVKVNEDASNQRGSEIAELCKNCEAYFNTLYAEVMAELSSDQMIKEIISFQLYAVNCALMKVKLLNKTRFSEAYIS